MKKLIIFTSPTCGPCQLFKPQVKEAASKLDIEYTEIDVTTDSGLQEANNFNVQNSGVAVYLIDNEEKKRWIKPCAAATLINDINAI